MVLPDSPAGELLRLGVLASAAIASSKESGCREIEVSPFARPFVIEHLFLLTSCGSILMDGP